MVKQKAWQAGLSCSKAGICRPKGRCSQSRKSAPGSPAGISKTQRRPALQCPGPVCNIFLEVYHPVLILRIHIAGGDQEIGCGLVVCDGDVVHLGNAEQRLHIRVVGLGGQRIGEKDDEVNPSLHYLGTNLLISPQRAAVEPFTGSPVASVIMRAVVPVPHRK